MSKVVITQALIDDSSDKTLSGIQVYDRDNGGTLVVPAGNTFPGTPVPGEMFWRTDQQVLYRRNDADTAWNSVSVDSSAVDHGILQGLGDDDHPQYQTDARADTWLGTKDTDDLSEGTNLYYTEARVSSNTGVSANTSHRNTTGNPHSTTAGDVGAIPTGEKGSANGVATLDGGGKVPAGQVPAVSLPEVYVVPDTASRLALTVQEGDEAIQTNDDSHWIWDGSAWFERPLEAVPNDTFNAVDTVGGLNLDGGWTDIPLNVVNHETVGGFGFTAPSADVTVNNPGVYVITAYGSTVKLGGRDRSDSELRLLVDTGGGYTVVSGTTVPMYNRKEGQGDTNASATVALDLPSNAQLKIQMRTNIGSTLESRPNGSGITIVSTRGQKGEKGDTGAGTTVTVEDEGAVVGGGSYDTLNFTGGLVNASDAGGGQANVAITEPIKDDQQASASNNVTETSTTDVLVPGMSITIANSADYMLYFSGFGTISSQEILYTSLYINGVQVADTERGMSAAGGGTVNNDVQGTVAITCLSFGMTAGDTVTVRWRVSGGTGEYDGRTLTVLER